jgi:tetratricopeptide (TPR) repeat protein
MLKLASKINGERDLIYAKANVYLANGCLDFAEGLYFKLLELQEKENLLDMNIRADIFHNLGMLAEKRGNFDSAIEYYQRAVDLNSDRSMTWLFLAKLYLSRFDGSRNYRDLKIGLEAVRRAEASHSQYPVIQILKNKYANGSLHSKQKTLCKA